MVLTKENRKYAVYLWPKIWRSQESLKFKKQSTTQHNKKHIHRCRKRGPQPMIATCYPISQSDLCCLDRIVTEHSHDGDGRSSVWTVVSPLGNAEYWQMCPRKKKNQRCQKLLELTVLVWCFECVAWGSGEAPEGIWLTGSQRLYLNELNVMCGTRLNRI